MPEGRLYKPAETAERLGITTMLLNKWVQHFGVKTEWSNPSNPENKGHRRYTEENLKLLLTIKEKVQDQNWSWDKTKAFLAGDETVDVQLRTGLESEIAELRKELFLDREKNQHFQESLISSLAALTNQIEEMRKENAGLKLMINQQETSDLQLNDKSTLNHEDFEHERKRIAEEVVSEVFQKIDEKRSEQEKQNEKTSIIKDNVKDETEETKRKGSFLNFLKIFKK
ncbi:MerR family transcriptional regulator [Microbacterium sp. APC 3898]|uniref:MerR family transcriptional regulator n=1 Tax=Planococcus notacanthi TaxID=3035188 RepID=A0ABT7ZPT1_9BACL|nr:MULTISPECIES: MerR family transcriptional regulator [Terrabacteria group]MDN3429159.1 MerR family transcriptional regulator [Planococcus sp. APC 4016]MDN3501061.1 MerR family transcriptional regulator [Microbacterium sp. APC 3898]